MTCRLEYTDERFVHHKQARANLPQIVDSHHQFVEPFCEYLRHSFLREGLLASSVSTIAERLLHLCNFIESRIAEDAKLPEERRLFREAKSVNEALPHFCDAQLEAWLAAQELKGNKPGTRRDRCDAVFNCFCWLEVKGVVTHCVRIPGLTDDEKFTPRLSCKPARTQPDKPRARFGFVSALRPKVPPREQLPIPGDDDVEKLLAHTQRLHGPQVAARNTLLIRWQRLGGLRRMEWVGLKVKNIPHPGDIYELMLKGLTEAVDLDVTKGGGEQSVDALADLLLETREYIDGPRADIVQRFKRRYGKSYKEPREVFLSNKTGKALEKRSVSNLLRVIFDTAGVDGHGHRLRASFLTSVVNSETEAEEIAVVQSGGLKHAINFHNVELRAAEKARSGSAAAIAPYINEKRKQRSKARGHDEYVTMDAELTAKKQALAVTNEQVRIAQDKLAALQSQLEASSKRSCAAKRPRVAPRQKVAKRAPVSSSDR